MNAVDWDALVKQYQSPALARKMLSMMVKELPSTLAQCEHAFEQSDWALLTRLIHGLRGACAYAGLLPLKDVASSLEADLEAKKPVTLNTLRQAIAEALEQAKIHLDE